MQICLKNNENPSAVCIAIINFLFFCDLILFRQTISLNESKSLEDKTFPYDQNFTEFAQLREPRQHVIYQKLWSVSNVRYSNFLFQLTLNLDASIINIHRIIEHIMKEYNNQVKANVVG